MALEPILREWYELAKPIIGTKEYAASLAAFNRAWARVRVPKDQLKVYAAADRVRGSDLSWVPERFDNDAMRFAIALCRELARVNGGDTFYLACRTAADVLPGPDKISPQNASSLLGKLCDLGVLRLLQKGSLQAHKANTYRFILAT